MTAGAMRVAGDRQWFPAQVPGSVYQDLLNSGMIDDPYDRDNELAALAVMDQDFEYELEFDTPAGMLEQEAVLLRFEGIDTVADLELNGAWRWAMWRICTAPGNFR